MIKMKLVKPGLFIGTREDANNIENLRQCNINRILTIDSQVPDERHVAVTDNKITRLHVDCLDEPTADLLSLFDRCIQFIEEGIRNNETVLVHCLSGVSRSVTIILAYLMKTESLTLDKAVSRLKQVYYEDKVNPNPGFMKQLRLYEVMENTVDESSKVFKQFKLKLLADQIKENGAANKELMTEFLKEATSRNAMTTASNDLQQYKCKKCRITLFHSTSIVEHDPNQGSHLFGWQKPTSQTTGLANTNNVACTSVFIDPVEWMSSFLLGSIEGKLLCPKCNCRLGSFNWSGMQCSCAAWITPAFQFHKNKIDQVLKINAIPSHT
ncbi:dual specificity protein phosphatase 12-like [Actinia tenebrosa]|uniref:Dual specificity protein phosphatase 12-like n=1 Tax=Actinia tenebrosa TaxID=6105 RepID=A0A6P8I1M9_ACTTE|nr:dual specificity protein phosphatase 12-like [Actinia tenebrosa]